MNEYNMINYLASSRRDAQVNLNWLLNCRDLNSSKTETGTN